MAALKFGCGVREGDCSRQVPSTGFSASGGMGVVSPGAIHLVTSRHQVLLPEMLGIRRLWVGSSAKREAAVKSERNVARGPTSGVDNGAPYMVMEYLRWWDLASWVAAGGPLPIEQAVSSFSRRASQLRRARTRNRAPRSPSRQPICYVGRTASSRSSPRFRDPPAHGSCRSEIGLDRTAAVMGLTAHMSPEQMRLSR